MTHSLCNMLLIFSIHYKIKSKFKKIITFMLLLSLVRKQLILNLDSFAVSLELQILVIMSLRYKTL